jgi:hypothetical protein
MKNLSRVLGIALTCSLVAAGALAAGRQRGSGGGGPSPAPGTVMISHSVRAEISAMPTTSDCENNPGPFIRLDGTITLGTIRAQIRFTNNLRGTHEHDEDIVTSVDLVSGEPIVFSKQPSSGGVGGNPWIYFQLMDCASGEELEDPILLGRCVQGLSGLSADQLVDVVARLRVTSGGCENNPGPFITLDGALTLGGVCARVIFTNNAQFTHVHDEAVTVEVTLIPLGQSIHFVKQPPQGGAGGNPHIFLQFQEEDGTPIGDEIYLGRCNKLE